MTRTFSFWFLILSASLLLSGCSEYEFKFNDRPVYTPKPLFSDYYVEDSALKDCIQQTIRDNKATRAEHITTLVCTNGGITSVQGVDAFTHIEQLNLADNRITDVTPLAQLPQLQHLDLTNNALEDIAPLMTLAHLERLVLRGNPALNCSQAEALMSNSEAVVILPRHCKKES